ncbi:MAG: class I adenylate cyclase [Pseudomonadota bacterium]
MTLTHNDPDAIARRIRWNHKMFQAYNIGRLREMMRYLPPRRVSLFQAVPFLLHVNHPELTGYVDGPGATFGIQRFYYSGFWKQGLNQFGFTQDRMRPYLSDDLAIQGLYLMGSIGTLAQTSKSDLDYWVVTDAIAVDDRRRAALTKKLDGIAAWGLAAFDQQITFFILDADQVASNTFTSVDRESSGSAQRTLLKEEFYRTFIFMAGRLPYWAVFPPRLDTGAYGRWINAARTSTLASVDDSDYIDLGPVDRIDPGECLGAVLWQLYKARHDPVKAMIKAALIGHYFFRQEELGLLCEQIKTGFSQAPSATAIVDPYAAVFEHAEAFFQWIQDKDGVDLIRQCIYLRLIGFPKKQPTASGSPKAALLRRTVGAWGWPADICSDLDAYPQWTAARWREFEERIIRKIGFVFDLLQTHGHAGGSQVDMDPDDLMDLKGRISAVFKQRPGKVDRCPAAIQARAAARLMIAYDPRKKKPWQLRFASDSQPVTEAEHLVNLVGWLIRNRAVSAAAPLVSVQIFDKSQSAGRIEQLVSAASVFFDTPVASAMPYRQPPEMDRLLVVFFSRVVFSDDSGLTASYLWRNSWGEYFCDTVDLELMDSHWSRLYSVADHIHRFVEKSPRRQGTYRILDCRLAPEPRLPETVADMIRTMDALNEADAGARSSGNPVDATLRGAPILDLL